MVLSEARGLRLSSVVRGGIGLHRRLSARRHKEALQCYWILFPRTRASQRNPDSLPIRNDPGDENGLLCQRRSSCLWFQMFGVEGISFLPDDQRDRGNLPRQGQACHGWFPSFDEQTLVEIVERPRGNGGHCCGTLEDILKIVVVILIESAKLLRSLGTL